MLWLLMDLILVGFRGLKGYKSELSAFQLTNILTAKLIRKHFTKTNNWLVCSQLILIHDNYVTQKEINVRKE